jgi:hypothetical protein
MLGDSLDASSGQHESHPETGNREKIDAAPSLSEIRHIPSQFVVGLIHAKSKWKGNAIGGQSSSQLAL